MELTRRGFKACLAVMVSVPLLACSYIHTHDATPDVRVIELDTEMRLWDFDDDDFNDGCCINLGGES